MSIADVLKVLAPAGGTLIGAGLAPFTGGLSLATGAMLGGAAGGLISGGLGLLDSNEAAGPTAGMYDNARRSSVLADRLMSGQGLSDTSYNRGVTNAVRSAEAGVGSLLGVARENTGRLSPMMIEGLSNQMQSAQATIANKTNQLEELDIQAEINNLKAGISANSEAGTEEARIAMAEKAKLEREQELAAQKQKNFAQAVGGLTTAIAAAIPKKQPKSVIKAPASQRKAVNKAFNGLSSEALADKSINNDYFLNKTGGIDKTGVVDPENKLTVDQIINNSKAQADSENIDNLISAWENGDDKSAQQIAEKLFGGSI